MADPYKTDTFRQLFIDVGKQAVDISDVHGTQIIKDGPSSEEVGEFAAELVVRTAGRLGVGIDPVEFRTAMQEVAAELIANNPDQGTKGE